MTALSTLEQYMKHYAAKMDEALPAVFPAEWAIPARLKEAMLYSVRAGGKRLRPLLVAAAAESLGGDGEAAMPAACAIELVHTYSLIHDDLPAMDDDDYRRGKPTNHKVYGEALAILAGDGLLTHAFFVLAQAFRRCRVPAERALAMMEELSVYAGACGMVGGQAADMLSQQGVTGLRELEYIHLRKTSDLIVFSLRAGGHTAGASDPQLEALTVYGRNIGLAFQIQDDLLDVEGDAAKLGKSTNSDAKKEKVTYPYLLGVDACRKLVRDLSETGKAAVADGRFPHPARLLEIADYLAGRDH